jgi:hypothetical protein
LRSLRRQLHPLLQRPEELHEVSFCSLVSPRETTNRSNSPRQEYSRLWQRGSTAGPSGVLRFERFEIEREVEDVEVRTRDLSPPEAMESFLPRLSAFRSASAAIERAGLDAVLKLKADRGVATLRVTTRSAPMRQRCSRISAWCTVLAADGASAVAPRHGSACPTASGP